MQWRTCTGGIPDFTMLKEFSAVHVPKAIIAFDFDERFIQKCFATNGYNILHKVHKYCIANQKYCLQYYSALLQYYSIAFILSNIRRI